MRGAQRWLKNEQNVRNDKYVLLTLTMPRFEDQGNYLRTDFSRESHWEKAEEKPAVKFSL